MGNVIPSRKVLLEAEKENAELGNENNGFLSKKYGFLPVTPPLLSLPSEFQIWDEIADELHKLYKSVRIRKVLDTLPLLDASEQNLPDEYLLRAQLLLGVFAHSYYRNEFGKPDRSPDSILIPWNQVCQRLNRMEVTLTVSDFFLYNWRFKDPKNTTRSVDNIDLLVNIYDCVEDRQFNFAVWDATVKSVSNINHIIEAQEAVVEGDNFKVKECLSAIMERLRAFATVFTNIPLFKYAENSCNPVIWARTTGVFAHPVYPKNLGPALGGMPDIHLLDIFLRRHNYESRIGKEQLKLIERGDLRHVKNFLKAVGEISLKEYIFSSGDKELMGLYSGLIDLYSGEKGFLGVHRLKAYGFIEGAIKAGRVETLGQFSSDVKNIFQEKAWLELNKQFIRAEDERRDDINFEYPDIKCVNISNQKNNIVVTLDLSDTGLDYRPGDYIKLMPENGAEIIERTIKSLSAHGHEVIELSKSWHAYLMRLSKIRADQKTLTLREFLKYAHIRPIAKSTLEKLAKLCNSNAINDLLADGCYQEIELWEVLGLVRPELYSIKRILVSPPFHKENISNIIPPLDFRTYSVSSYKNKSSSSQSNIVELLIQPLKYSGCPMLGHEKIESYGVASNYLTSKEIIGKKIPATLLNSIDWKLPEDTTLPVVMFAAGSGIAPFRSFISQAINSNRTSPFYLFISVDKRASLWFKDEIENWLNSLNLTLFINCTQEDVTYEVETRDGKKVIVDSKKPRGRVQNTLFDPSISRLLWDLMRTKYQKGQGAYCFICGQTGFGQAIYESLIEVAQKHIFSCPEIPCKSAHEFIYKLVADFRLMTSTFTSYRDKSTIDREIPISELVQHNNADNGYWMLINDFIYDVTDFINIHPGGYIILINNSGVDATLEYESIGHHLDAGVNSKLETYLIGRRKHISFTTQLECVIVNSKLQCLSLKEFYVSWQSELFTVVEMQNAASNMFNFFENVSPRWNMSSNELLAFRMQSSAQDHQTFVHLYLSPLIGRLNFLWSITAAICSPNTEIYFLETRIKDLLASPTHQKIVDLPTKLAGLSKTLEPTISQSECDYYLKIITTIKEESQGFLSRTKEILRQGILVFEEYGDNTLKEGGIKLLDILMEFIAALETYENNLGGILEVPHKFSR